jgi:DNA-binding XRE family transcriptional regulator
MVYKIVSSLPELGIGSSFRICFIIMFLIHKEKMMQETAKVNPQAFETARKSQLLDKNSLARMAGVSSLTITRLETGKPVLLKNIKKVMHALGFTVDDKDRFFM